MSRPTKKQFKAIVADFNKFYEQRPDNLRQPYAVRVEGFLDGLMGREDTPAEMKLRNHYEKGHRVGHWLHVGMSE